MPNHHVLQLFCGLFWQVYDCILPAAATLEAVSFPAYPVSVVYPVLPVQQLAGAAGQHIQDVFFYAWLLSSFVYHAVFIRQLLFVGFS